MTATGFWKKGGFAKRILREVRDACVDTKPRGTEATCIVSLSGDRPKLTFSQCEQQKALRWPVNEATVKFVCAV